MTPAEVSPIPSPTSDPIVIIAFGDSLTAGKDLADPSREAYPALLEKRLRAAGHDVVVKNEGYSGNTTYDALDRLDFSVPANADIVLVALGANDTFQGKKVEEIESNLRKIVKRIKAKGATPLLFEMKTFPNLGPFYAVSFIKLFERLADDEDIELVPFFLSGVATVPELNLPDGIHPNAKGHEKIVENIYPQVEKAVNGVRQ